jgi:hypothetical protein
MLLAALAGGAVVAMAAPASAQGPGGGISIKVDDGTERAHQGSYTYKITVGQSLKNGTVSLELPQGMRFTSASAGGRNTENKVVWRAPAAGPLTVQAGLDQVPQGVRGISAVACMYPDRSQDPLVCSTDLDMVAGAAASSSSGGEGGIGIGTVLLWLVVLGALGGGGYWFYRNRLAAPAPRRHRVRVDEELFEEDEDLGKGEPGGKPARV